MDPKTFAAARATRLTAADEELEPFVRDSLEGMIAGDPEPFEDLVTAASVLWLEHFKQEAPHADGEKRMASYQESVLDALEQTESPGFEVSDGQVTRVTYWLSGYTVNSATVGGIAARGGKHKLWVSHHDDAVREIHENADGQIVPVGATFTVGGFHLHFPGEPVGPPEIWINCRCLAMPAAREGDAMSAQTYTIGPEDQVEDDNPDIIPGSDIVMAAAVDQRDVDTEPIPVEDDAVPDEPEDDEELITEIPVHGVLAPEGVATGDGRMFALESLSTRDLPVPLLYEYVHSHGGDTSMTSTVGRVDKAWRDEATNMWRWQGAIVLSTQYASEAIDGMVNGMVRGVSIDGDAAEVEIQELEDGEEIDLMELLMPSETVFSKMRVAGLTIVPIPAFQEAYIALGHDFQEDLTDAEVDEQVAALQACGCFDGWEIVDVSDSPEDNAAAALRYELFREGALDGFRDVSTEERKRLADDGAAMPDGSYPIANCEDLKNAIQAIGRASDPEATKAHIRKRKSALGCDEVELPEDWSVQASAFVDTHDGPGWITDPIPTARIRNYWTHGKGAAKIRWGAPGDFNRCRMQLVKYVQNPDWLAGMCANMHYEALGFWPAQHHGSRVLTASASTLRAPVARLVESESEVYPSSWFQNPGLGRAVPLRIEKDTRRCYGYVAEWGICHVGMSGMCQEVPQSQSDYGYYLKGILDTDAGEQPVGVLSWGGHASPHARMSAASEFYDKPDAVRAFVNVGEDEFGVWFAGIIPPDVSDADIAKMRAIGAVSGDWREVRGQLELIGVPVVNTPGFPVLASAASGRQTVLIGAGALKPEVAAVKTATFSLTMDPETVGAIARTAVAEYRHQEKVAARAEPARAKVRQRRLDAARAKVKEG
jgi:hypothetical protein